MKKILKIVFALSAVVAAAGCSTVPTDEISPNGTADRQAIRVEVGMNGTRADADISTVEASGFGMFVTDNSNVATYSNLKWSYASSAWSSSTTPLYWTVGSTSSTVVAYAPYTDGSTATAINCSVKTDQSGGTADSEFLFCTKTVELENYETPVAIAFDHKFCKITVDPSAFVSSNTTTAETNGTTSGWTTSGNSRYRTRNKYLTSTTVTDIPSVSFSADGTMVTASYNPATNQFTLTGNAQVITSCGNELIIIPQTATLIINATISFARQQSVTVTTQPQRQTSRFIFFLWFDDDWGDDGSSSTADPVVTYLTPPANQTPQYAVPARTYAMGEKYSLPIPK